MNTYYYFYPTLLLLFTAINALSINNGKLVSSGEFEAVVKINIKKSSGTVFCTGTFVSSNTIISAAHCLSETIDCKIKEVKFKNINVEINGQELPIKAYSLNDNYYNPMTVNEDTGKCQYLINPRYDLSFLILEEELGILPMNISFIPKKDMIFSGARALGFGGSFYNEIENLSRKWFHGYKPISDFSGKKQIGNINLLENKNWALPFQNHKTTYFTGKNYSSDFSQLNFGDSGGPLINYKNEIIGINSAFNKRDERSDSEILLSTTIQSSFTPLNREENYLFLKSAKNFGSTLEID